MPFLAGRLHDGRVLLPCRPLGENGRSSILFVVWNQATRELLMISQREVSMKNWFPIMAFLVAVAVVNPAIARPGGCVKGAIVGGIVGHFTGHAGVGAATGCAYGLHQRHQYDRQFEFIVVAQLALELEGRFPCPACPLFRVPRQLQTMPSTRCPWRPSGQSIAFG
jgi:hypothetical protein